MNTIILISAFALALPFWHHFRITLVAEREFKALKKRFDENKAEPPKSNQHAVIYTLSELVRKTKIDARNNERALDTTIRKVS